MATAEESNDEEDGELKNLDEEVGQIQTAMKELFEKATPINNELGRLRLRKQELAEKRHRLTNEQRYREKHQRVIELESQLKLTQSENVRLKQCLDQATKQSKPQWQKIAELEDKVAAAETQQDSAKNNAQTLPKTVDSWTVNELEKQLNHTRKLLNETKEQLNETRQRLSAVQDRLTLSEQVTAATQQRALQEFDNSEQLQLELAPQQQTTSHTGRLIDTLCVYCTKSTKLYSMKLKLNQ